MVWPRSMWKEARSEKFFQVEADTILGRKRFYIRSKDQRSTIKEKENENGTYEDRAKV